MTQETSDLGDQQGAAMSDISCLSDGYDGSGLIVGPNHSTIEIWYDTEDQAVAARRVILDLIDAAVRLDADNAIPTNGGGAEMKHKTAELEGGALDAAVAMVEGLSVAVPPIWKNCEHPKLALKENIKLYPYGPPSYSPSTDWDQGGRIIEREGIAIYLDTCFGLSAQPMWIAGFDPTAELSQQYSENTGGWPMIDMKHSAAGPTPLIAAMRAFVAARLGDEVEIPEN
jgi:hypothetical protein